MKNSTRILTKMLTAIILVSMFASTQRAADPETRHEVTVTNEASTSKETVKEQGKATTVTKTTTVKNTLGYNYTPNKTQTFKVEAITNLNKTEGTTTNKTKLDVTVKQTWSKKW